MKLSDDRYRCGKCGGSKRSFFVRAPFRLVTVYAILSVVAVAWFTADDPGLRLAMMFAGASASGLLLRNMYRRRCLACDPEWKGNIWYQTGHNRRPE
jgi:hypothetical protein